jgi:ABC-type bacteriocin/lantibiotic exporter with double-glycine peptidase domain
LGLTSPDKGQIFIDGVDHGDLACSSLRRQIGYVATEKTPFPGTLREYLQLGQIEEKESEMS